MLRVENRELLKAELAKVICLFERKELNELFDEHGVPAGNINNMREVFELPYAEDLVLEEQFPDGEQTRRVKTVAFKFKM